MTYESSDYVNNSWGVFPTSTAPLRPSLLFALFTYLTPVYGLARKGSVAKALAEKG